MMTCRFHRWLPAWSLLCLALGAVTIADAPAGWVDDLSPIARSDWNAERAAHLIERAGFGATPDEIARLAAMTPQQAVDTLVDYDPIDNRPLAAFEESGIWDPGMDPFQTRR